MITFLSINRYGAEILRNAFPAKCICLIWFWTTLGLDNQRILGTIGPRELRMSCANSLWRCCYVTFPQNKSICIWISTNSSQLVVILISSAVIENLHHNEPNVIRYRCILNRILGYGGVHIITFLPPKLIPCDPSTPRNTLIIYFGSQPLFSHQHQRLLFQNFVKMGINTTVHFGHLRDGWIPGVCYNWFMFHYFDFYKIV